MRRLAVLLCLLPTFSATLFAERKRPLRFEEMVKLGRLGGFAVSPDGSAPAAERSSGVEGKRVSFAG